jgi:hypothetical protein
VYEYNGNECVAPSNYTPHNIDIVAVARAGMEMTAKSGKHCNAEITVVISITGESKACNCKTDLTKVSYTTWCDPLRTATPMCGYENSRNVR